VNNRARVFANDAQVSIAGELLADTQPYMVELDNAAYEELQDDLTLAGVETQSEEIIITGLPAVASPDPAVNVSLSFTGFNNGTTNSALPALPADMRGPLRLWERPTGQLGQFAPMTQRLDGLPSRTQSSFLRWWQWIGDALVFIGALQQNDIKVRYNKFLPALVLSPQPSPVLIMRSKNAMAWKIVELFCQARGAESAMYASGKYDAELAKIVGVTTKRRQRAVARRRTWGSRRRRWS
jgi:hypothetical protein